MPGQDTTNAAQIRYPPFRKWYIISAWTVVVLFAQSRPS